MMTAATSDLLFTTDSLLGDEDLLRVSSWSQPPAKPYYIQSKTGNVVIDVGGIPHHVKMKNFRQKVLPCSR